MLFQFHRQNLQLKNYTVRRMSLFIVRSVHPCLRIIVVILKVQPVASLVAKEPCELCGRRMIDWHRIGTGNDGHDARRRHLQYLGKVLGIKTAWRHELVVEDFSGMGNAFHVS